MRSASPIGAAPGHTVPGPLSHAGLMPRLRFAAWLAMVVLVQGLASPVQAAVITILDGDAVLIDGAEKFSAVEGQHLVKS